MLIIRDIQSQYCSWKNRQKTNTTQLENHFLVIHRLGFLTLKRPLSRPGFNTCRKTVAHAKVAASGWWFRGLKWEVVRNAEMDGGGGGDR